MTPNKIVLLTVTALNLIFLMLNLTARSRAEIAGKDWIALAKDNDFRQAVGFVVGQCSIDMERPAGLSPKILCGN
jgi:hypothetical protein